MKSRISEVTSWLKQMTQSSQIKNSFISFEESFEWSIAQGSLVHKSGGFFKIIGIKWINAHGKEISQPLIEQNEIGTLGFLARRKNNLTELLVQAKVEPGNVGFAQLSPTHQATLSNSLRLHGGNFPPFTEFFLQKNNLHVLYESLQSEQGLRFFGKRNKNIILYTHKHIENMKTHRWFQVEELMELLHEPYLINTDARSVLVSSPWEKLINRIPFTRYKTNFAKELYNSFVSVSRQETVNEEINKLSRLSKKINRPSIVALDKIQGWTVSDKEISTPLSEEFSVKQIRIKMLGREVGSWDQPILYSPWPLYITLLCGKKDKILYFAFKYQIEPGLYNLIELGPTDMSYKDNSYDGQLIIKSHQSEEGGRFYQNKSIYRIIDIGEIKKSSETVWLTLGDIHKLFTYEGIFTNEARSILVLLLHWL
ncbi:MAG: NDP-hexose 23-dehydratase [Candidatus Roizmanbacteria bacterium GW2011_GWA2_32_13]|uniref:NDP-hexose 23-dehydratase n=1 Tax=Candidatus Roizmanbacteria bacterium GW2011_GWA2_32_13 TaxID=1618475 RepID=A0A0F9YZ50_9BACT|nr:MAG: NDP-hexose 23-dehydratase [Candidatus Roizmanbacteria bacterium GW2011_GWA2_32_13]